MFDSLPPHELQHTRPPCPSPTPGVHSDSRPSSQWCHPAISSSAVPFSSCPQSLPASVFSNESNLCMRWPKYWSFSFSIIPSKEHPGLISFRMDWLGLLAVQGTLKSLLQNSVFERELSLGHVTTDFWLNYRKLGKWELKKLHSREVSAKSVLESYHVAWFSLRCHSLGVSELVHRCFANIPNSCYL